MCGISAFFLKSSSDLNVAINSVRRMNESMRSRGPDSEGLWSNDYVVLGHRRLSIQDLDSRSNQPFHSGCSRYSIVYNGEIYNFKELKESKLLKDFPFKTNSDTEVLLALYSLIGSAMLPLLRGMFSFIIWDNYEKQAFVARDPYGIKPLYYAYTRSGLMFGSQVKALIRTSLVSKEPSVKGQMSYWLTGSVAEPYTWFKDVLPFLAGYSGYIKDGKLLNYKSWFSISNAWHERNSVKSSRQEALEFVTDAIRSSVKLHLTSDVPVGIFLSGGLDSASIAGLMVDFGVENLKGVTLKFNEYKNLNNDEVPAAKKIADHFGIDHHVKVVSKQEFNSDLPKIIDAMDQPSIDGVNTWYASKAVSEIGLKVVLSGIGGDELFSGYSSFKRIPPGLILRNCLDKVNFLLPILDYAFRIIANKRDDRRWNYFLDWSRSVEGAWLLSRGVYSVSDLAVLMCQKSVNFDPKLFIQDIVGEISASPILAISQMESSAYLKNQLLRDSDWASMSHGLELRTPLVDHILLQQIQPFKEHLFNKFALVNAPINKLPSSVLTRKKTGFNTPVNDWLQESMKKNGSGSSRTSASTICELYSVRNSF